MLSSPEYCWNALRNTARSRRSPLMTSILQASRSAWLASRGSASSAIFSIRSTAVGNELWKLSMTVES